MGGWGEGGGGENLRPALFIIIIQCNDFFLFLFVSFTVTL